MIKPALSLPGHVYIAEDVDDLVEHLAGTLYSAAMRAVNERGVFHLALSGGSTPEPLYMALVIDPRYRMLPWEQSHVWLVDERRVPESDERSNMKMLRESLLDHVPIEPAHVHAVATTSDDPAMRYEQRLREVFEAASPPVLDFVVLGMGEDGHTASLFPQSPALEERERWVANNDGPTVTPPPRVTMTYPLLNAARELAVMVTGEKKAATLQRVDAMLRDRGRDAKVLPITGIEPVGGRVVWFVDRAAAGLD